MAVTNRRGEPRCSLWLANGPIAPPLIAPLITSDRLER